MQTGQQPASLDLDGAWSFAYSLEPPAGEYRSSLDLVQAGLPLYRATVPGNLELDLQAAGIIVEPFYGMNIAGLSAYERAHVWYSRRFRAEERPGTTAELVFEGLGCCAEVYLDGVLLGMADNMLIAHTFRLDGLPPGEHELLVHIRPAVEEARRYAYPPSLSALQSNYESLEVFLETLEIAPDHSRATLALHYQAVARASVAARYEIELSGRCGDAAFCEKRAMLFSAGSFSFSLQRPPLWWPRGRGEPALYDCRVRLLRDGQELDRHQFRHGIRTVSLEKTSITDPGGKGEFCFRVNGEKVYVQGSNWVPVDAFHSRDRGRIARIISLAEDLGCNSRKLAYSFIKRSQEPLCLVLQEPQNWRQALVACSDLRCDLPLEYTVRDVDSGELLIQGRGVARADAVTVLGQIPFSMGARRFYLLAWQSDFGPGRNHYLAGNPPFELAQYRGWLEKAGMLDKEWLEQGGFLNP